jgi:uncharacterized damage-inducible protein DinB
MKKWFERPFNFDLPVSLLPNLVERLRGTPARAEEIVSFLPAPLLTRRDGERWSIQENLGHLLDLEPLWLGRVDDITTGKSQLREADLTNRKTHTVQHNAKPVHEILRGFRAARAQLVERLEALDEAAAERAALHPRLGQPMRLLDLVYFVAEHDDHHLGSIRQLRRHFEQQGGSGGAETNSAADAVRRINEAWLSGRLEDLAAIVHPDIVMVLPGFTEVVQGRDAFLAGFRDFCENAKVHEFHERDHQVSAVGDTAVTTFHYDMIYERAGKRSRSTGRDFWVFQKSGGRWIAVWRTMLDMEEETA